MTSLKTENLFSIGEGIGCPTRMRPWNTIELIKSESICISWWSLTKISTKVVHSHLRRIRTFQKVPITVLVFKPSVSVAYFFLYNFVLNRRFSRLYFKIFTKIIMKTAIAIGMTIVSVDESFTPKSPEKFIYIIKCPTILPPES
jgi:hypothetical protein